MNLGLALTALLSLGGCAQHAPEPAGLRPQQAARAGIWSSASELARLPVEGPAWEALVRAADGPSPLPRLRDPDDDADVIVLAQALVFARTGERRYREQVAATCAAAMNTERGGDCLALARNISGYVLAADLVGLPEELDGRFRDWLRSLLTLRLEGRTIVSTHEGRPNNWGTHAGAGRLVIASYLRDTAEIERVALVFRGWLGDRSSYAGFRFRDAAWQADERRPVGINPKGARKNGHNVDGVLPDDQRRGGGLEFPPEKENYVYEALQGALLQAVVLDRAGYDVWAWQDQALLRAFRWLHDVAHFPAEGDDLWQPHVVNAAYGSDFPVVVPAGHGKSVGWTDWSFAPSPSEQPPPDEDRPPR